MKSVTFQKIGFFCFVLFSWGFVIIMSWTKKYFKELSHESFTETKQKTMWTFLGMLFLIISENVYLIHWYLFSITYLKPRQLKSRHSKCLVIFFTLFMNLDAPSNVEGYDNQLRLDRVQTYLILIDIHCINRFFWRQLSYMERDES